MSQKLKLLFDECIGRPILKSVADFLALSEQQPELGHVLDYQEQGIFDEVWIPKAAADDWILITADRGKRGKQCKGVKLPLVCRRYNMTHIMLSASIHQKTNFNKARIIVGVWDDVVGVMTAPRGSGFSLQFTSAGHAGLVQVYSPGA